MTELHEMAILYSRLSVAWTLQSSRHGKDCSYNPIAFPPSMEVRGFYGAS